MNKGLFVVTPMLLFVVLCLGVGLTGCTGSEVAIMAGGSAASGGIAYVVHDKFFNTVVTDVLHGAGYEAAVLGLKTMTGEEQRISALALQTIAAGSLNYLNGGALPTADQINTWLISQFGSLSPAIRSFITQAAVYLEEYVPTATAPLTPLLVGYVVAFVQGLEDGATAILANPNVSISVKYTTGKSLENARSAAVKNKKQLVHGTIAWFQFPSGPQAGDVIEIK